MIRRRLHLAAAPSTLFLGLLASCGVVPPSQPAVDILVEKEVSDLKIGLRSPDTPEPLRLYERMDDHGVDVVSIALVNEGELRWARSFGEPSTSPAAEVEESEEARSGVFPTPGQQDPITEYAESVDVGELVDVPLAILALRPNEDEEPIDVRMQNEILDPLEMTHSRFESSGEGALYSTAEDLTMILTDLQKAHAGKPARRLRQEQAQALFDTGSGGELPMDLGLDVQGTGQAVHFERRAATPNRLIALVGFVFSGHGAVVIVDNPEAATLADEILSGLAELYDWPAYRAEFDESASSAEPAASPAADSAGSD